MADPVSISTLVSACVFLGTRLKQLSDSYRSAPQTIQSLCAECNNTIVVLNHTRRLLKDKPQLFSENGGSQDVKQCFESAVKGIEEIVHTLREELSSYDAIESSFRARARFAFDDEKLKGLLQTLKDQRTSVDFLINCIQKYLCPPQCR
jgi:hypothetical protein